MKRTEGREEVERRLRQEGETERKKKEEREEAERR